jgi:phage/plasmid primase-like uncharacterized protein
MKDVGLIREQYSTNIRSNLKERGVDPAKTGVWIDDEGDTATFPLYNLSGQLVGYQFYNPQGSKTVRQELGFDKKLFKYFPYITGPKFEKHLGVWGLESYHINAQYLFITEGIFDTVKIHNAGYPAIAVMSNDPRRDLKRWLMTLPQIIIAIADNDDNLSGNKLVKFANKSFKVPDPYKDLGDMPQNIVNDYVVDLLSRLNNVRY